ncbi:MAG TPA: hypothetical protein VGJ08_15970 [Rhizomicrobium sp.]
MCIRPMMKTITALASISESSVRSMSPLFWAAERVEEIPAIV